MARTNAPLLGFNRGIISPKALGRVDLDRTKLSAEAMTNWLPKSQGAMTIRPGTKYLGSSINDTGAEWIEFVAATDDTALIELTHQKMRIWIDDELLGRPSVSSSLTLSDTGWSNTSTGGTITIGSTTDVIPAMTAATTSGVTISASSALDSSNPAWRAADNNNSTWFQDTGNSEPSTLPTWWNVNFGSGNTKSITEYSIRKVPFAVSCAPAVWSLLSSDYDTGTYATDTGKWTCEDTQGSETGWAVSERRTYRLPAADTGTIAARRNWRLHVTATEIGATPLQIAEVEMFTAASSLQVQQQGGQSVFNARAIGSLARREKRFILDTGADGGVEHSLDIFISRGPVTIRVGSSQRDDDYIRETNLGTGYHNLSFTPIGDFWVTLQSDKLVDRIVGSLAIGDTGTVELTTFIDAEDIDNVRFDQSADVLYLDCAGVQPHKIERRGTGRSWSFVKYEPNNGPFLPVRSSSAKLSVSYFYGNTTMNSDIPFFTSDHIGGLVRLFHNGQGGVWALGQDNAATDPINVTGISDTGTATATSERRIVFSVSGTWSGRIVLERSFDGADVGFKPISGNLGAASDTGTFTRTIDDPDDNLEVWYRARIGDTGTGNTTYTSGTAIVTVTYLGGGVTGIGRITQFNSNTSVGIEVLSRFSDTGTSDNWQEGSWSNAQSFPSSVALHEGRLAHAGGANIFMSVADDYENFDDGTDGDAAPIIRTLGSGPVDAAFYLISLLRLVVGTAGAEISVRSSSLDEPLTPTNASARAFSTQGSSNLRAMKMDTRAVMVQRSGQRVFMLGFGQDSEAAAVGDYKASELTMLVPDLMVSGVRSVAIQRQPDTRVHCVLADGRVAILTYEPQEEVICWSLWETDGSVEKAMVLPGVNEDQVYYHINRTIGGQTKRFLEKWAMETECEGDTGLSWLADCAVSYSDTGRVTTIHGADHLIGESVIVWGDDTGQSYAGKDYSPDVDGVQTTYVVDTGGNVNLTGNSIHHAVVGLPYHADYKSTKLAYAAQAGTALAQMKRTDKIGFCLYQTHNNALFFGNDTGKLDALPRKSDAGAVVDSRKIFRAIDILAMPFPGLWDTDSRIHLRAKAPRPVTVLAAVPTVQTNEKV